MTLRNIKIILALTTLIFSGSMFANVASAQFGGNGGLFCRMFPFLQSCQYPTPYVTPYITPYATPYATPYVTPYATPYATPYPTPPVSAVTKPVNVTVATGNSGSNVPFAIGHSPNGLTFFLYNNAVELDRKTVTSSCASGSVWDGVKCAASLSVDLRVNGGDHGAGNSLLVQPGATVFFTWSTLNGNSSLRCSSSGGAGNWPAATRTSSRGNHSSWLSTGLALAVSSTPGMYQYLFVCEKDTALGMDETDKFISFFNPVRSALAAIVSSSDSVFVQVSSEEENPGGGDSGDPIVITGNGSNPATITSGEAVNIEWSSTGTTSCIGTNFDTGGAPSGSVELNPTVTTTFTITCDDPLASTANLKVTVRKKPVFEEN